MLHLRDEFLQGRVGHIADEKIAAAVFRRQQMVIRIRSFRYYPHIFVVSGAELRCLKYPDSKYQVPGLVVSGTGDQRSIQVGVTTNDGQPIDGKDVVGSSPSPSVRIGLF